MASLMQTYARLPVSFSHGEGAYLFDDQGTRYLDALSGIAVCGLGHAHPAVSRTIVEQTKLLHTSNVYGISQQQAAAEALCSVAGMNSVFFSNSGAEANEAAIKLARLYGHQRGIGKPTIVVMEQAFHGRTLATLTASGNRKIQAGFEPLVQGFTRAPYGDLEALRTIAQNNQDVVAVLLEPIQGEGGVRTLADGTLQQIREICDANDWLMMLDEVQTGNGRTGRFFACQHSDVAPDVLSTAKGLGNGMPIGACLAKGKAADLFQPGHHGSTFGGNPMVCAVAKTVIDTIAADALCDNAARVGAMLMQGLRERLKDCEHVKEVRGQGMMIGIELDQACGELVSKALDKQLLINVTAGNVVRLLPPLILNQEQAEQLLDTLCPLIAAHTKAP